MIRKSRQSKLAAAGFAKRIMKNHIVEDTYGAKSPGRLKKAPPLEKSTSKAQTEVVSSEETKPRGRGRPRKRPLAKEESPKKPPSRRRGKNSSNLKEEIKEEPSETSAPKIEETRTPPKDLDLNEILGGKRPRLELNRLEMMENSTKIVEEPEKKKESPVKSPCLSLEISACSDVAAQNDSSGPLSPKPAYKTLITYKKSKKERCDSKPEVSTEDIDEIIEAAKRRSILSPSTGSPIIAEVPTLCSPVKEDTNQVVLDPSINYPDADVAQDFFQRVGLIKKSDLKLEDPTKSKLHREGGGRLRRHIKPKMAPHMVYRKLHLAKGCVLHGVMDDGDEDDFRAPSREASPRVRSRPSTPRQSGNAAAAARGSPSAAALKLDFDALASPPRSAEEESILDRRSKLVQLKKTFRTLTGASAPFVKLYERPDRVGKQDNQSTRKSTRQRDSKRKEWWHLLRANPDEYEEDLGWTEEQIKKEKRRQMRLLKVEEELLQHGLSLQALQEEVEKEDEEARKTKKKKKMSGDLMSEAEVVCKSEVITEGIKEATVAPKRVRRRKKKGLKGKERSISIVGPDGKPLDPKECGPLLDELKPLLVDMMKEVDEPTGAEANDEKTVCQVTIEAASLLVPMQQFYSYDPASCVFPHMCDVCHRNDHSYVEDKFAPEKRMSYQACIHRTPCPHFDHQTKLRAAPKLPSVSSDPPSCESDLVCAEEMLNDSDHEEVVEPLNAQLAVRAAQIQSSLGVSTLPIIALKTEPHVISDVNEEDEAEEEEEVVVELLGANQILEHSSGLMQPPNYSPSPCMDDLIHGIPEDLVDVFPVLPAYAIRLIDQYEKRMQPPKGSKNFKELNDFKEFKAPLKQSLIKVKVQRLDKDRLVIKQSVHDRSSRKQYQETTVREIRMPMNAQGLPVLDSEFISKIIAKEALRLVSENPSKALRLPEVTDKMRTLLTKSEMKKLEVSLLKLLEKDPEGMKEHNVDLFGLHSIEERHPLGRKCNTITYKILPPTAEESARELQRTIKSVETARSHGNQSSKEIVFNNSDISGESNEDAEKSVSFTTRDIRMKRPGVMECIRKQKLRKLLSGRLRTEEDSLLKLIADAQFLVAKLKEDVSQKQLLLGAIKLQNAAVEEEKVSLSSEIKHYCAATHNNLKSRATVLEKVQTHKKDLLYSYNHLLAYFGQLCKEQSRASMAVTQVTYPAQTQAPPSPPSPPSSPSPPPMTVLLPVPTTSAEPPTKQTSYSGVPDDDGQFLKIPVPVPNQPGQMAFLNIDRNLIVNKGHQTFSIDYGGSKFMVSLSNPNEPSKSQLLPKPEGAHPLPVVLSPSPTAGKPQSILKPIQAPRAIAPAPPPMPPQEEPLQFLYASSFSPDAGLLASQGFTDAQQEQQVYVTENEVPLEEQTVETTFVETSEEHLAPEAYESEVMEQPCYDNLPTSQGLVRSADLLHTAMAACDLEKTEQSTKLGDSEASVEVMQELTLPEGFSGLMEDGCQIEEFLDEVVVGREQEVFSQELQTSETVVQSGQELVAHYTL